MALRFFLHYLLILLHAAVLTTSQPAPWSAQLDTIRAAYATLGQRVAEATRIHVGDLSRVQQQRDSVIAFTQTINQNQHEIPHEEYETIQSSLAAMLDALEDAAFSSLDQETLEAPTTSYIARSGRRGRPRIEIDQDILAAALEFRGPTHLAPEFGCSARTVRRRALESELVEPGPPVYVDYEDEATGEVLRWYQSSTAPMSLLLDDELDQVVKWITDIYPDFGRKMLDGQLKALGHHVPRSRLRASYERVMGAPAHLLNRRVQRRRYCVAGPNSLWHHDGQHGLIRWRVVIHGFIDGYSRLVTGIHASDNNRASTVYQLFRDATDAHGMPSRVRGDHGVENLLVAEFMERNFGVERGSYIWGRSVHNIRIERLWVDVTRGFGVKWYNFFMDLEFHYGLCPDVDADVWLLHTLFLDAINQDAIEWAEGWNCHLMELPDRRAQSPRELFFFTALRQGLRAPDGVVDPLDEAVENPQLYGVDWEDLDDRRILAHHAAQNGVDEGEMLEMLVGDGSRGGEEEGGVGMQGSRRPTHMAEVEVPAFDCPLTDPDDVETFSEALLAMPEFYARDMPSRRSLWVQARQLLRTLLSHEE